MARCFVTAAILSWLLLPSTSLAEHVRVQLKGGGEAAGELKEYVPGDHLTIDLGDGKLLRVAAASAISVQISPAGSAAQEKTPPEQTGSASTVDSSVLRTVKMNALLSERQYWLGRYTGLGAPIALSVVAAGSFVASGILIAAYHRNELDHENCIAAGIDRFGGCNENVSTPRKTGIAMAVIGSAALVGAATLFALRTSERRQKQELHRIDSELRTLGSLASIAPWFAHGASTASGVSAGLTTTFRF